MLGPSSSFGIVTAARSSAWRARWFDQSAIFSFDGGSFWLVGALADAKVRQLA